MSKISMLYREVAAPPEISHLVLSFWEFTVKGENCEPATHEVFPEGCVSLIYKKNAAFHGLFIHGLSLETFNTPVFAGEVFWGMRFIGSACAKILRKNPAHVLSHRLDDSNEFSHLTENLEEKLAACQNFNEAAEVFKNQLKTLNLKPEDTDEKVFDAIKIIEENLGEIKISELAKAVRLSVRQLERRFKTNVGLSPKQFARARRIRATAVSLVEETKLNWANRAVEMGFADQAHLTHEFSRLTGRSPNSFAEKVKLIKHGDFVK
jgi:methylphosphotriester-DNA--protein-cysteine methyltransferase